MSTEMYLLLYTNFPSFTNINYFISLSFDFTLLTINYNWRLCIIYTECVVGTMP